jgi:uncharacterized protein (UPF0548 family)
VFTFRRPTAGQVKQRLASAAGLPNFAGNHLSLLEARLKSPLPSLFAHDVSETTLGRSEPSFEAAKLAFRNWNMFDLGWVRVANPDAKIAVDALVAVEAQTLGLWTLNISRIVAVVDTARSFGFIYATTGLHVEEGEESFLLNFDPQTRLVRFRLEAVSRPHNNLARIGYPITRVFQRRFAQASHQRMREAVCPTVTLDS